MDDPDRGERPEHRDRVLGELLGPALHRVDRQQ